MDVSSPRARGRGRCSCAPAGTVSAGSTAWSTTAAWTACAACTARPCSLHPVRGLLRLGYSRRSSRGRWRSAMIVTVFPCGTDAAPCPQGAGDHPLDGEALEVGAPPERRRHQDRRQGRRLLQARRLEDPAAHGPVPCPVDSVAPRRPPSHAPQPRRDGGRGRPRARGQALRKIVDELAAAHGSQIDGRPGGARSDRGARAHGLTRPPSGSSARPLAPARRCIGVSVRITCTMSPLTTVNFVFRSMPAPEGVRVPQQSVRRIAFTSAANLRQKSA